MRPTRTLFLFSLLLPTLLRAQPRLSDVSAEEELGVSTPTAAAFPGASLLTFDPSLWHQAREAVETGREPGTAPVVSTSTAASPPPADENAGLINVDLPYQSGLSIAGRKLIRVKIDETIYKSAAHARELGLKQKQSNFDMHQELQVKIKGKVGPKIAVNVDFDDTKDDKKDISVVYTGDPDEVVQEAAFGDIVLSLPSTEFVSYSKQLFGVRAKLKYKNAQLMMIGSRTKGVTETKRFNGDVKFDRKEILDTSYIRHRIYRLKFTSQAVVPGTIEVWRDDQNGTNNVNTSAFNAEDFAVNTSTQGAFFDRLVEGIDYSLDLSRGILTLSRDASISDVLAVDYVMADGTRLSTLGGGLKKLIKTSDDLPIVPGNVAEDAWQRELKTFYSIGQTRLVPDDGRGNFLFRTEDLNRLDNSVFLNDGRQLKYPDTVEMDFTNGRFNLSISTITGPVFVDTTTQRLYDSSPEHKFSFVVEYRYKVKSYVIKPNIVFGSERVTMNGRLLSRDVDYFMDYDSGFLTFFNEDQIDETTQIEVTYEFAPFGTDLGETLVGARTELDLVPGRFKAGSTFMYNFAPKPTIVPDIRSTPRSLMVLEADGQLKDWNVPFTPATLSLTAEVAKSKDDPNIAGKALIDSMEGLKQEIQAVMGPEAWHPSANPDPATNGASRPDSLWTSLGDETFRLKDINPGISSERENDKIRVMDLPFAFQQKPGGPGNPPVAGQPEEVSIVESLSRAGLDFSKKLYMEMWVQGAGSAGSGVDMEVNVGEFNEDADGDGVLDTEDANRDGSLNFGEDVGWIYDDPGSNGIRVGPVVTGSGNGRLDTEDFDGDGALRRADVTPRGSGLPIFRLSSDFASSGVQMVDPVSGLPPQGDLGFTGWRLITVPLNISVAEEPDFQAVKQVRLTFKNTSAAARQGSLRIGRISFVGTTWEKPFIVGGSSATLTAVNNVDNPGYRDLRDEGAYKELYKDEATNPTREQTLSVIYQMPAGSTVTTRQVYPTARDFSTHQTLNFFLQLPTGRPAGGSFALQIGSETDYYEYRIPLTSRFSGMWVLESLRLTDLNDDGVPDILEPLDGLGQVTIVGSPSLQRVGQVKLVLHNDGASPLTSELYVDEIYMTGARKRSGYAQRFSGDLNWPQWGSLGARVRQVDRNFQTLTAQILNQDKNDSSANATFTRIPWLPLSGNVNKAQTVTPAVFRTGDAGLVSVLSEGKETSVTGRGDGQLLIKGLPDFGFSYDKALAKSTTREEKRDRDTYTGTANYTLPWTPDLMPGRRALKPLPQSVYVKYARTNSFFSVFTSSIPVLVPAVPSTTTLVNKDLLFQRAATLEMTDEWSVRAPFSPWDGLSVQPTVSWRQVRERRRFSDDTLAAAPEFAVAGAYPKGWSQTLAYSGSWRMAQWLEPRFDGELTGSDNNIIPTASSPTAFNVKTIDRNAKGNLFWTFRAADLAPNFKPTQSYRLENSYRIENGDAYENIDKNFGEWKNMKPFVFKRIDRQGGRRMYGLLEPLDVSGAGGRRKQLTALNSLRTSFDATPFDWIPLHGRAEPLRTFRMTATLTDTDEHSETGEAIRDATTVVWPDLLFSVRDTERIVHLDRWMRNSQLNLRSSKKDTKTFGVDFRRDNSAGSDYHFLLKEKYDVFASYGVTSGFSRDERSGQTTSNSSGFDDALQVGTKLWGWQVTPRAELRSDKSVDAAGRSTQDTQIQTYAVLMRLDKAYPGGFRIPFTHKIFEKVNRLIVDGKVGLEKKTSSIDVERNNTDTYSADLTGEWEVSKNFRLSFGGGMSVINNRVRPEFGITSFNMSSTLVITF